MTPLEERIRERITLEGPIPVSEFMALALGDPNHGYYRKADPLGAGGDFITAPEISQAFGELIGLWCAVSWRQAGEPETLNLVEMGPGRGTLMKDALRAAKSVPAFTEACTVHLIETSPVLRTRQEEALIGWDARWHETLQSIPRGPALIIANEFFDALPIDQYERTAEGWHQRCIGLDTEEDRLCYIDGAGQKIDASALPCATRDAAVGSLFETCPAGLDIADSLGARIASDGIAALIIDYGHSRSGVGDTLQAVRHHKPHEVLADPGDADLTAHVDFAALAERAEQSGVTIFGPVPQGAFLSALGIEARTEQLAKNADSDAAELLRSGCHRLIDSDGMGMLFKAMALTNDTLGVPAGFDFAAC